MHVRKLTKGAITLSKMVPSHRMFNLVINKHAYNLLMRYSNSQMAKPKTPSKLVRTNYWYANPQQVISKHANCKVLRNSHSRYRRGFAYKFM